MRKFWKKIKHFIEFILFLILCKGLKLLGIDYSASICSKIARIIGPFLPVTKNARENIINAFGKEEAKEAIINGLWDNFGRFIGEFPFINSLSEKEINKRVQLIGLEHVKEFQESNIPFLLFTGHFANWDLVLRVIQKVYPKFGVVYRHANNPYINNSINSSRKKSSVHLIAKGVKGAKDLIKSIKSGDSIAMLVDQKMNDGIEVPFFGRPAMTSHAIAKFALQFNYPIIPCQIIRTNGSYFKVVIYPPLTVSSTGIKETDCYNIMVQINSILEDWIRQHPSQWFWFHNRWNNPKDKKVI